MNFLKREFLIFLSLLVLPAIGGILNRIRGGWLVPRDESGNIVTRLGLSRLVYAIPTALLVFFLLAIPQIRKRDGLVPVYFQARTAGRLQRALSAFVFGCFVLILTFFSLFISKGEWASMGREDLGNSPSGIFDWLIGRGEHSWLYWRRWFVCFSGMSLRGLTMTTPIGMALVFFEHGTEFLLCGIQMGLIYEVGWNTHSEIPNFSRGIEVAEFSFGYWQWFTLICSANFLRKKRKFRTRFGHVFYLVYSFIMILLLLISVIWYPLDQTRETEKIEKDQAVLGAAVACFASSVFFALHIHTHWKFIVPLRYRPGIRLAINGSSGADQDLATSLLQSESDGCTTNSESDWHPQSSGGSEDFFGTSIVESFVIRFFCKIIRIWNVALAIVVVISVFMNVCLLLTGTGNDDLP